MRPRDSSGSARPGRTPRHRSRCPSRASPPSELAQKQQLVDVVHAGRVRVAVLVDERGELHRARAVAGFLEDLARHRLRGRIVHIHPAARQRPAAVAALAHQQHPLAVEDAHRARRPSGSRSRARPPRTRVRAGGGTSSSVCSRSRRAAAAAGSARGRTGRDVKASPFCAIACTLRIHSSRVAACAGMLTCPAQRVSRRGSPAAGRADLRITSFSPDHTSSTAHTLMSTSVMGSATSRITSSVMSVATSRTFSASSPRSAASGRIALSALRSAAVSAARRTANR